ncbi:energy transducer TonB [Xylanibacter oryzae]|uniref:energy transducer TonB n=1 Tax=Xylanibacter oryzae TaxID=185293 RepID=UPI000A014EAC|nr:energy transducer TonB [Xylanibacter oryzae]
MKKTILTLLIMLCPVFTFAGDYILVKSTNSMDVYANNDITENNGTYRVWVKYTYRNTKAGIAEKEKAIKQSKRYGLSYFLYLREYNLKKKQCRNLATYVYSKDDDLINSETNRFYEFEYIIPNSVDEAVLDFIKGQLNEKVSSQQNNDSDNHVFDVVEQMPSFPGGNGALMDYISKNIKYPTESDAQGRVIVTFIVEKDGSITNAKVTRSVDPAFDKEALRVINSMPKWIPGKQNGQNVRVRYTVPVTFRLQ